MRYCKVIDGNIVEYNRTRKELNIGENSPESVLVNKGYYKTIDNAPSISKYEIITGKVYEVDEVLKVVNVVYKVENVNINDIKKYLLLNLYKLIPIVANKAYKTIIEKPDMSEDVLQTQLALYRKKYDDAKAGLDVFEGQALALGLTQEEYRAVVTQKGEEFLQAEKLVNDRIELVRSMMEKNIDVIESVEDVESVKAKFVLIDGFKIDTPVTDIVEALK